MIHIHMYFDNQVFEGFASCSSTGCSGQGRCEALQGSADQRCRPALIGEELRTSRALNIDGIARWSQGAASEGCGAPHLGS